MVARVDKDRHTRFRKAGYDAIDRICAYYYSLREKPVVAQVKPGFLRDLIPKSAPQKGQEWTSIVNDYQNIIISKWSKF